MRAERTELRQRTPEWHEARLGKITGSRAGYFLNGGVAAQREIARVANERITGQAVQTPANADMARGREAEPHLLEYYAQGMLEGKLETNPPMYISLDGRFSCSPDGIATIGGERILVECKCPRDITVRRNHYLWNQQTLFNAWLLDCDKAELLIGEYQDGEIVDSETIAFSKEKIEAWAATSLPLLDAIWEQIVEQTLTKEDIDPQALEYRTAREEFEAADKQFKAIKVALGDRLLNGNAKTLSLEAGDGHKVVVSQQHRKAAYRSDLMQDYLLRTGTDMHQFLGAPTSYPVVRLMKPKADE